MSGSSLKLVFENYSSNDYNGYKQKVVSVAKVEV